MINPQSVGGDFTPPPPPTINNRLIAYKLLGRNFTPDVNTKGVSVINTLYRP